MSRSVQKRLLLYLLGAAVVAGGVLAVFKQSSRAGRGESSALDGIRQMAQGVRARYDRWKLEREQKRVLALIRDSDVMLEGNGSDYFVRLKPAGPDGKPVRTNGADAITRLIPPEGGRGRGTAVLLIPSMWMVIPGTTNTGMEAFVLDVADKLKAHGFRKVTVVTTRLGLLFDGGLPSRQDAEIQKVEPGIVAGPDPY